MMPISATGILTEKAGFTLLELLVVMTLLSIFSFISLPLIMNQADGGERQVLRRLAGTVKQLYNEATLTHDEHLLSFDLARNSMSAFRLRASFDKIEKEPFGREFSFAPLKLKQVDVAGKGIFRSGQVEVRIFPLGWMDQVRVGLVSESGADKNLNFSPLTGSATIENEPQLLQ